MDLKFQKLGDKGDIKKIFSTLKKRRWNLIVTIWIWKHPGSGWVVTGIGNLRVDYYKITRNMKSYGTCVEWSKGVPGSKHEGVRKLKNLEKEAKVYKKKVWNSFNFPADILTPNSIKNCDKI